MLRNALQTAMERGNRRFGQSLDIDGATVLSLGSLDEH